MNKLNSTAIKKQLRFRGSKIASPMASANSAPHMLIQAADMIEAVENKVSKLPAELMVDFNDIFKGDV